MAKQTKRTERKLKLLPKDTTLFIVCDTKNSTKLYETNCVPSNLSATISSILAQYKNLVHYISVRIYYKTAPSVKLNEFTCFSLDILLIKKTLRISVPTVTSAALYATKPLEFSIDTSEDLLQAINKYVDTYAEKE